MSKANPLTPEQSACANELLALVRERLKEMSAGDSKLLHHLRRRIRIRLEHDERGTPNHRRKLKYEKWITQNGLCALCPDKLPAKEAELDRIDPYGGYTPENTQLIHHSCHRRQQAERGFA